MKNGIGGPIARGALFFFLGAGGSFRVLSADATGLGRVGVLGGMMVGSLDLVLDCCSDW